MTRQEEAIDMCQQLLVQTEENNETLSEAEEWPEHLQLVETRNNTQNWSEI